jgi:integrase
MIDPDENGQSGTNKARTGTKIGTPLARGDSRPVRYELVRADGAIQCDRLCAHADKDVAALATFMFSTGCRIGEALRLEWEDIDFKAKAILIRKTKTKRQRLPYMPSRLLVALANLDRDKKPFHRPQTTLRDAWDRAVEAAGIERLTFHCCRHGFATSLLRAGFDVVTVAKLGGWESAQLVLSNYGHAQEDQTATEALFSSKSAQEKTEAK